MSMCDLLGRTWAVPVGSPPTPAAPPPPPPVPPPPDLPDPPALTGQALTVDDAWAIFGVPQKRAPKAEVKRRYLAFAAKWHPDKHPAADQAMATAQLSRANAAWTLLNKHCNW